MRPPRTCRPICAAEWRRPYRPIRRDRGTPCCGVFGHERAPRPRPPTVAASLSDQLRNATTGALGTRGRRRAMSMSQTGWTSELVADRLAEAADVLARLPEERAPGLYDLWPRIVGAPCTGGGPAAAMPEAIDCMDEALRWLTWLELEERRLVWLRAEGMPWKR